MATTFNEVMETMLTKEEQEAYRAVVASLNKEQREEYDNLIKKHDFKDVEVVDVEEEDKSDYWIVYGEYHEKDGEVWTNEKFRYDTLEEAEAEHSRMTRSKEYNAVYLDEMTWDAEAGEWDDDNIA